MKTTPERQAALNASYAAGFEAGRVAAEHQDRVMTNLAAAKRLIASLPDEFPVGLASDMGIVPAEHPNENDNEDD